MFGKAYFIEEMNGPAIIRPASFDPKFTCTLYIQKSNKAFLKRESKVGEKVTYMNLTCLICLNWKQKSASLESLPNPLLDEPQRCNEQPLK